MTNRLRPLIAVLGAAIVVPAATAANSISFTPPATAAFAVTLDGTDKTGTYSLAIPVSYTSSGQNKFATNGWHITATSTTFIGNSTAKTLATTASTITAFSDVTGCTLSNCTDPTNTITYPTTIPAGATAPAALTVYNAASPSGAGNNTLTMQVGIAVPANTFADVYTSTLTLAIIEGP